MKPNAKMSLFNSLSSDMVTNVALTKVCTLPSARSSLRYLAYLHVVILLFCFKVLIFEMSSIQTFLPTGVRHFTQHFPSL